VNDIAGTLECLAGVHGLRAICRTITARSKQDAAVKLLFHAITEDITGRQDSLEMQRAACYSLAATRLWEH
jgi:hypothetical protein